LDQPPKFFDGICFVMTEEKPLIPSLTSACGEKFEAVESAAHRQSKSRQFPRRMQCVSGPLRKLFAGNFTQISCSGNQAFQRPDARSHQVRGS
jgi:hypothetical protein